MAIEEGLDLDDNYTQDGTVDLKGKPVLRSKTGGWTACSFVMGISIYIISMISRNITAIFYVAKINMLFIYLLILYVEKLPLKLCILHGHQKDD